MKYNTPNENRASAILIFLLLVIIAAGMGWIIGNAANAGAEGRLATCWTMCKPGTQVNVRRQPSKNSRAEGYLDAGDPIRTDGESRDGWIHVYGVGEAGEGWVYCGYVATEKPQVIGRRYVCVATKRLAIRKWMGGPQVDGRAKWLNNGEHVEVFLIADGWAMTSRGYVRSEWLEEDPE